MTNGKVYAISHYQVDVYGLINGVETAAAPMISPNGGTFTSSQSVTLTSTTANAQIYYTLDGSTPTPASTLYSGPITISTDTTLQAIASAAGDSAEPDQQRGLQLLEPDAQRQFHAGRRNLLEGPAGNDLRYRHRREDLFHA